MSMAGEGPYIQILARQLGGICEAILPVGRADVATGDRVFEVEPYHGWRNGLRQVLAYEGQTGLVPCLALFGIGDYEKVFTFLRRRLARVELWGYRYRCWGHITSVTQSRKYTHDS